eukprot:s3566_g6.t1
MGRWDRANIAKEYFELLRTVRQAQWIQECGPSKSSCPENRFNRPLGIPLLLDTALRIDNVGWYIGFAEHQPTLVQVFQVPATKQNSNNSFQWRSLSTQTLHNPDGDVLEGCEDSGCTYPTQKLVLAQFGFAAESPLYGSETEAFDPSLQQKLTGEVFKKIGSLNSCAEGGVVVDEWVDDWGRSEAEGCGGSVFQHPRTGPCDEVRPGRTINTEWFGLNGQYTFLSFHCLDPRFHRAHPAANGTTVGANGFRFEDIKDLDREKKDWDNLPGGFCALMYESNWLLLLEAGLLLCGAGLEVFYLWRCCCFRYSALVAPVLWAASKQALDILFVDLFHSVPDFWQDGISDLLSDPLTCTRAASALLDPESGDSRPDVISVELGTVAGNLQQSSGQDVTFAQAEATIPLPEKITGEANVDVTW